MADNLFGVSQSLHVNSELESHIRSRPLPSASIQIHDSLALLFYVVL